MAQNVRNLLRPMAGLSGVLITRRYVRAVEILENSAGRTAYSGSCWLALRRTRLLVKLAANVAVTVNVPLRLARSARI